MLNLAFVFTFDENKCEHMNELKQPLPQYMTEKRNIVRLILLTAGFALVFINIYNPFGSKMWINNITDWEYLFYSSLIILTGVLVVVVSRIIMYYTAKRKELIVWNYLIWIGVEIFSMALFYTLFEKIVLKDTRFILDLYKLSVKNTTLVLLLPYSVLWLYFSWEEKQKQIKELIEAPLAVDNSKNMIPFHDEKGVLKFSIKLESLLYIESADNYVNIFYIDKGKIVRFTLRNSIKRIEEAFKNTEIIRCHRSYIVNFDKVKVLRKNKEELALELDAPTSLEVPVSKTYVQTVMETFTKFSLSQKQ